MGRHSLSYIAAQQALSAESPPARGASTYIGRVGLLAVALGIGAAVAGGTAIAGADTTSSNAGAGHATQSSGGSDTAAASATRSRGADAQDEASDPTRARTVRHPRIDDDPGSAPQIDAAEVAPEEATTPEADPAPASRRSSRADDAPVAAESTSAEVLPSPRRELASTSAPSTATTTATADPVVPSPAAVTATVDPVVPAPTDQAPTEYGDIGKWMLQSNGKIADYGGLPYQGKTVLEPINIIIVDPTSKNSLAAAWRLNTVMWRAGFPPQPIHSTGFRGFIDDIRYRQRPQGLLTGYSDAFFLLPNNHGRIFGPDPVETSSGFVWTGAFSTEKLAWVNGLPRHVYVSSDMARDALAAKLVASGRARLGGTVSLANAYNTETTTTGDHDGYAVVVILTDPAMLVGAAGTSGRTCIGAGPSATSTANAPCTTVTVATVSNRSRGPG